MTDKAYPDLVLFGQALRNDSEDLKLVSGTIMRTMVDAKVSVTSFFEPHAQNLANTFPTNTGEAWFSDFIDFTDKLDEAGMMKHSYVEHFITQQ